MIVMTENTAKHLKEVTARALEISSGVLALLTIFTKGGFNE